MAGHQNKSKLIAGLLLALLHLTTNVSGQCERKMDADFAKESSDLQEESQMRHNDYSNWVLRDPIPLETNISAEEQAQARLKRSIHKEKIPKFSTTNTSPYSSIVVIAMGCIGTLISPFHVLTAAHCVHDGRKMREGHLMNPLKVGIIRRNGRQHRIRVKKIFVSKEIRPNTESRFAYDYAVLKLVRPHKRPYLPVRVAKKRVRALTFHILEKERHRRSVVMYKYSHCPIYSKGINFYKILAKDCLSSQGDSGSAVFDSLERRYVSVIGLLSAWGTYRSRSGGLYHATIALKFTQMDVLKIRKWVRSSS